MAGSHSLRTVLFDLDGTLADTAPDLAYAVNRVLEERGASPLPVETLRPVVSLGGRAMIQFAFDLHPDEEGFEALYQRFLQIYRRNVARESRLFPGMDAVLDYIEGHEMNWGIVTNKTESLTVPLMDALGLSARAACLVGGDTTSNRKPHPEPLLFACKQVKSPPWRCVYVGDAPRDIAAGQQAGMQTLVALFGYIPPGEDPLQWGADGMLAEPADLMDWIRSPSAQ